jgi:hypothetical protein
MKSLYYILFAFILLIPISLKAQQDKYFDVQSLDFNKRGFDEMYPVPYQEGIIFCANYKTEIFRTRETPDQQPLFDIYYSEIGKRDKWTRPIQFSKRLNTKLHEGPACFNSDHTQLYFTRNNEKNFRESNKLGIYIVDINDTVVSNERPFKYNNEEYNVAYPSISKDGKYLFFASDNPEGIGRYDIYVCEWNGSEWSAPENLGETINTRRNEVMPFIHPGGRLYFSTRGFETIGRHDIFYSEKVNGAWIPPVNPGEPINSRRDDFGFYIDETYENGYLSSDRERSSDVFSFHSTFPELEKCSEYKENTLCYVFYEKGSMDLDSTTLKYEWDMGDGTKVRSLEAEHCFDGPGTYLIQLNVIDTLTGEIMMNEAVYEFEIEELVQTKISAPDTIFVNQEILLDGQESNLPFEVDEYFWRFGDNHRATGIETSHFYRQPGTYKVKLAAQRNDKKKNSEQVCTYKKIVVLEKK